MRVLGLLEIQESTRNRLTTALGNRKRIQESVMTLEGKIEPNYELVSQLRHVIRVRKLRNNVLRCSWLMVGALIVYKLAALGMPFLLNL